MTPGFESFQLKICCDTGLWLQSTTQGFSDTRPNSSPAYRVRENIRAGKFNKSCVNRLANDSQPNNVTKNGISFALSRFLVKLDKRGRYKSLNCSPRSVYNSTFGGSLLLLHL